MFFSSQPVTGVLLVAVEVLEESLPEKRIVWIFNEELGWIDVAAFLNELLKSNEIMSETVKKGYKP